MICSRILPYPIFLSGIVLPGLFLSFAFPVVIVKQNRIGSHPCQPLQISFHLFVLRTVLTELRWQPVFYDVWMKFGFVQIDAFFLYDTQVINCKVLLPIHFPSIFEIF